MGLIDSIQRLTVHGLEVERRERDDVRIDSFGHVVRGLRHVHQRLPVCRVLAAERVVEIRFDQRHEVRRVEKLRHPGDVVQVGRAGPPQSVEQAGQVGASRRPVGLHLEHAVVVGGVADVIDAHEGQLEQDRLSRRLGLRREGGHLHRPGVGRRRRPAPEEVDERQAQVLRKQRDDVHVVGQRAQRETRGGVAVDLLPAWSHDELHAAGRHLERARGLGGAGPGDGHRQHDERAQPTG